MPDLLVIFLAALILFVSISVLVLVSIWWTHKYK